MPCKVLGEITHPFSNLNGVTVEFKERIRNSTHRIIIDVIIHPFWEKLKPCW